MTGPLVSLLWIAFAALWIFTSSTLGHILTWLQGLPLVLEIILWIIFLPWVGSLYIWGSDLALWLKILIIVIIAFVTMGIFNGRSRAHRRKK